MDLSWQKERREMNNHIADLKRNQAAQKEIQAAQNEYNRKDKIHCDEVDKYLHSSRYRNKVGAFEGAGYCSIGMYRPMLDCIMFSKEVKPFCKVCRNQIEKVIRFYSD